MARATITEHQFSSGDLPPICVRTGEPTRRLEAVTARIGPKWLPLLLIPLILPYFVVRDRVSHTVRGSLPLSHELADVRKRQFRDLVSTAAVGVIAIAIGLFVRVDFAQVALVGVGLLVTVGALFVLGGWYRESRFTFSIADPDSLVVHDVHPRFRDAVAMMSFPAPTRPRPSDIPAPRRGLSDDSDGGDRHPTRDEFARPAPAAATTGSDVTGVPTEPAIAAASHFESAPQSDQHPPADDMDDSIRSPAAIVGDRLGADAGTRSQDAGIDLTDAAAAEPEVRLPLIPKRRTPEAPVTSILRRSADASPPVTIPTESDAIGDTPPPPAARAVPTLGAAGLDDGDPVGTEAPIELVEAPVAEPSDDRASTQPVPAADPAPARVAADAPDDTAADDDAEPPLSLSSVLTSFLPSPEPSEPSPEPSEPAVASSQPSVEPEQVDGSDHPETSEPAQPEEPVADVTPPPLPSLRDVLAASMSNRPFHPPAESSQPVTAGAETDPLPAPPPPVHHDTTESTGPGEIAETDSDTAAAQRVDAGTAEPPTRPGPDAGPERLPAGDAFDPDDHGPSDSTVLEQPGTNGHAPSDLMDWIDLVSVAPEPSEVAPVASLRQPPAPPEHVEDGADSAQRPTPELGDPDPFAAPPRSRTGR